MTSISTMIERAASNYKARLAVEGAAPERSEASTHPLPTKKEAWDAWVELKLDRDEPLDREGFEEWWTGR